MTTTTTDLRAATYVVAIGVDSLFVDPEYQRELEHNRAKGMSLTWDPRLVGALEVSDRGPDQHPRYAVINGQHRMAAARLVDPGMSLPCTVHTGLTVADEARLFWDIDRTTKKLTNWDRWYARRAAGDRDVAAIDAVCAEYGFVVTHQPGAKSLQCCSALEFVRERCELQTLREVLEFIGDVWPGDAEARKATVIKGLALVLHDYDGLVHTGRLADVLSAMTASQLVARAHELKSRGWEGGIPKLTQTAALIAYNGACRKDQKVELP
ncbi:DUF6551 family protein [Gordonia sp. (in: high G+C Gram-positive bacteria)]|uniref:DUF6551 family protein n=1 Tax=Gordonia sp. (in: high G+C Gram-positive bacteria) TaxID=84139 RepID=UPI003C740A82